MKNDKDKFIDEQAVIELSDDDLDQVTGGVEMGDVLFDFEYCPNIWVYRLVSGEFLVKNLVTTAEITVREARDLEDAAQALGAP